MDLMNVPHPKRYRCQKSARRDPWMAKTKPGLRQSNTHLKPSVKTDESAAKKDWLSRFSSTNHQRKEILL